MPEPDVFAALANPTRRELLRLLLERGEQPVQRLAEHFAMRRPSLSEHLKNQFLSHPPAKVWRALTDSDLIARWLMPNDFVPVVGHRFTFRTDPRPGQDFDGTVHCEVLDLDPPHRLRWAWRGGRLDTVVTWTLVAEGRGTRLFLEHAGFDPDDPLQRRTFTIMDGGWRSHVLTRLAQVLAPTNY